MRSCTGTSPAGYIISRRRGGGSTVGKTETEIQNAIRVALSEIGIVRRNNVGTFLTPYGAPIAIGIPGESDLTLFFRGGRTIFIEVKTPSGKQSKQQKRFQAAVERLGFEYIIMRSVKDAEKFIEDVRDEE